jgi:rifampicin phosphotransferase
MSGVVRGGQPACVAAIERAIDAEQVRRVADLAQRVEGELGRPQDIEWALAGGSIFLLQARPITALPQPPKLEPLAEGSWQKDDMHYPLPLTPFGASVYLPAQVQSYGPLIERFGLLFEGADQESRGGEVYTRMRPIGGKDRAPPPWVVVWLMSRLVPVMRRRSRAAKEALRTDAARQLIDRWNDVWRDEFPLEAATLGGRDLAALSDHELLAHLDAVKEFMDRGQRIHLLLCGAYVLPPYELGQVCEELLRWGLRRRWRWSQVRRRRRRTRAEPSMS